MRNQIKKIYLSLLYSASRYYCMCICLFYVFFLLLLMLFFFELLYINSSNSFLCVCVGFRGKENKNRIVACDFFDINLFQILQRN